ncbi:MAG TPA: phosphatase PAP2-related protein [Myxococcales bacterium]|nr:phosphatase PAP2-related protein [Myxococcales bacterium]
MRKAFATHAPRVAAAFAFRAACYAAMLWMALWAEARPAPPLPDAVLDAVPYVPAVDRYNYAVWVLAYVPVAVALLLADARRFCRYMVTSGVMALARGACIAATGLGPVHGPDVNAGMSLGARWEAFQALLHPLGWVGLGPAHAYLTKDLFFSGHTATTFLLLLYAWPYPRLRWPMLVGHAVVVATVFLSHLHYTIDVAGAYAVALSAFALAEGRLSERLASPSGGPAPPASSAASR